MKHLHQILLKVSGCTAAALGILAPFLVRAQCTSTPCYDGSGVEIPDVTGVPRELSITELILEIIAFVLDFVLILAVLMLVIAGVYLIVSLGDDGSKDKAKKIVLYVILGIVLIVFARAIVVFTNNFFI